MILLKTYGCIDKTSFERYEAPHYVQMKEERARIASSIKNGEREVPVCKGCGDRMALSWYHQSKDKTVWPCFDCHCNIPNLAK